MNGEVRVRGLFKNFESKSLFRGRGKSAQVLKDLSFDIGRGELAALVGESGSGKTTLGRCLLGLIPFDAGEVSVNGFDVARLTRREEKAFRMSAQMVFQNPYASLDPAFRVADALREAVAVHHRGLGRAEIEGEVRRLAHLVHLPPERLSNHPPRLSGGEKRRVVFARALATNPSFVVTDEPVSGLDQPIQAQLLELLKRIHQRQSTTMLFISHDLKLVRYIATRVMVMHRGRIVEDAPTEKFFGGGPVHPYSRDLLASAFVTDPAMLESVGTAHREPEVGGCSYRHRCRVAEQNPCPLCVEEVPPVREVGENHRVACHLFKGAGP